MGDLVAGRADFRERTAFWIGQVPVEVTLGGKERALIAAPHRDDDVGLFCELPVSSLG